MQGYRTLLVAMVLAVGGVLETFDWATVVPQNHTWSGMAMLGVGALVAVLRYMTTTPVGTRP